MTALPPRRQGPLALGLLVGAVVLVLAVVWLLTRQPAGQVDYQSASPRASSSRSATAVRTGQPARTATATTVDPETRLPWIDPADLPSQARDVLALIDKGGPFRYSQDGQTFGNNEGRLPDRPRGFYKEYTVKLPSSPDRGPVRIVTGGDRQWYLYTADHYATFSRIRR